MFHFFELRMDKAAQWEIRNLANAMFDLLYAESEEWAEFLEIWKARL
jgi:thymidylate synthase ThyX